MRSDLAFKQRAERAILDPQLQASLLKAKSGFVDKREVAVSDLYDFELLRDEAAKIKDHTLSHLDRYLLQFEAQAQARGTRIHWALTVDRGVQTVLEICQRSGGNRVIKGKSMVGEEMELNHALEKGGFAVTETDLGEYIIQLAKEAPSHIIAPAVHKSKNQVSELFLQHHRQYGYAEPVVEHKDIVQQAREVLRAKFLNADIGITGANFLIAESGSTVLVTNEGNGDLCSILPRVLIITVGIEKVLPDLQSLSVFLRILGRSATGQNISAYTSLYTGSDASEVGMRPQEVHIVLLDNGRSEILGSSLQPILRCIRCGACLNHCPVYTSVGGHAYDATYPGPIGAVLMPSLAGLSRYQDLPNACSLNGRCEDVCPLKIPFPNLLREQRNHLFRSPHVPRMERILLATWSAIASRVGLYRAMVGLLLLAGRMLLRKENHIHTMPFASAWLAHRDLPKPPRRSFIQQWHYSRKA